MTTTRTISASGFVPGSTVYYRVVDADGQDLIARTEATELPAGSGCFGAKIDAWDMAWIGWVIFDDGASFVAEPFEAMSQPEGSIEAVGPAVVYRGQASGLTVHAVFLRDSGGSRQVWDTTLQDWAAWDNSRIQHYGLPLAEEPEGARLYEIWPDDVGLDAGAYLVEIWRPAGESLALTDELLGALRIYYDGVNVYAGGIAIADVKFSGGDPVALATVQSNVASTKATTEAMAVDLTAVMESVSQLAAGDGDVAVNHDTGGTDALRYMRDGGEGADNVDIRAYLASDYDAGTMTVRARATTGPDGRWLAPMMLNDGVEYVLVARIPGVTDAVVSRVTV